MTTSTTPSKQGLRPRPARADPVRRRARRVDRQRRAAVDRPRARLLPGRPVVGRQRLHAHLRRLPAARRAPGRPARPPPDVHRRPRRLRRSPRSLGGLAQSDGWLIVARAVQGLGAALLSPAALSLVTTTFSRGRRAQQGARASGARSPAPAAPPACCSAACSPQWAGWEWVLFVNVPIGLAAALLAPRLLPRAAHGGHAPLRRRRRGHRHRRPVAARLRARRRQPAPAGARPDARARRASSLALIVAFVVDRARHAAQPLVPFSDLPPAHAARRQRRRAADRHVAVLDVLLHLALHAAGAGLRRAEDRPRLPAAGRRRSSSRPGVASQLVTRVGFKPVLVAGLAADRRSACSGSRRSRVGGTYLGDVLFPSLIVGARARASRSCR